MSENPWIIDVDVNNFSKEVLERSQELPVVVDFWAPWCGPCRTLGPLLERFAQEANGAFVLAKVDTDRNPELAQAFQIQGIPTVIAIDKGRPLDGFSGALPPGEVKSFLDRVAPPRGPGELEQALALEAEGRLEEAIATLRGFLREQPENDEARIQLARLLIEDERLPEARKVFERVGPEAAESDAGRAVRARLDLSEDAGDVSELESRLEADPGDHATRIELGRSLVAAGRQADGLEHLLEVVKADRGFEDDAARKAMLEVFEALGDEDPVTQEYRQRLQMVLLV